MLFRRTKKRSRKICGGKLKKGRRCYVLSEQAKKIKENRLVYKSLLVVIINRT